jgi:hypothetical protein
VNHFFILLADILPMEVETKRVADDTTVILPFALIGICIVIAVGMVIYMRGAKTRKTRRTRHHRRESGAAAKAQPPRSGKKRRRKLRRAHRPVNPTLAETGGLPPMRDENAPLPPMP